VAHELQHHLFQLAFRHLTVSRDHPRPGDHLLNVSGDLVDRLDAVVDEIHLPSALQLVLQRRTHQLLLVGGNHGLNCDSVLRRCLDYAHVAQSYQGHMQGARNGRGGHGQHIHLFTELLQAFFVAHAEALFFVDDHQS